MLTSNRFRSNTNNVNKVDEGIGAVAASKLADLARAFILKARPIIILHNPKTNQTATIKLKRGLINHQLILHEENKGDRILTKSISSIVLLTKALNEARKLITKGYIEI